MCSTSPPTSPLFSISRPIDCEVAGPDQDNIGYKLGLTAVLTHSILQRSMQGWIKCPCWVLTKLIPGHVAKCEFPYVTGRNFHKIILLIFYCCEWKRYEIEAHMGLRFEFLPSRVLDLKKRISRWTFMIFFNSSNYCLWILLIFIWYDEEVEKVW